MSLAYVAYSPRPLMDVRVVTVIGAGTMGAGIAQVCAQTGWEPDFSMLFQRDWKEVWGLLMLSGTKVLLVEKLRLSKRPSGRQI